MDDRVYDVVVIGGGASGLSAALVLARSRRRVLLVDSGAQRNLRARRIHAYPGHDGETVRSFLASTHDELRQYDVTIVAESITGLETGQDSGDGQVALEAASGEHFTARRVLVATGITDILPPIQGLRERWGRDVFSCPICHGYEYADRVLGVIGRRFDWLAQCVRLKPFSKNLVLFAEDDFEPTLEDMTRAEAADVRPVLRPVRGLVLSTDGSALIAVTTDDGKSVACDALFINPGTRPNDDILRSAGASTRNTPVGEWVAVDPLGRTSLRNIWAVGNVVDPGLIAIGAAGAGAQTALAINGDLLQEELAFRHRP